MGFHHLFHPTIIVMIAFLTNSNSLSFSGDDDFLFSGAELPSDDGLLPLNSPEAFDSLFSDSNNNNNNNGDLFSKSENDDAFDLAEPFELAECSSFENSQDWPLIGKSRIRRVRSTCPNPDAVPGAGAAPLRSDFDNLPADAGAGLQTWGQDLIAERKNQQCQLMTIMLLAWGVCYQPTGEPLISHGRTTVPPKTVQSYYLDKCMLAPGDFSTCPDPSWEFYCCASYIPRITSNGPSPTDFEGSGFFCVPLPELQQGGGPFEP